MVFCILVHLARDTPGVLIRTITNLDLCIEIFFCDWQYYQCAAHSTDSQCEGSLF